MRKFMKTLPIYNGKFNKLTVGIAFHHFMGGTRMKTKDGYEITTQAGFIREVISDADIKVTEKQIRKIVNDYNKEYPTTPDTYRELKQQLNELQHKNSNNEKIIKRQNEPTKMSLTHRKKYTHNAARVIQTFYEHGIVLWSGEEVTDIDRLTQLIASHKLIPNKTLYKLLNNKGVI